MKYIFLSLLVIKLTAGFTQTLTEVNFTTRIADWDGHLSGQFAAITCSSDGSVVFAASHPGGIFRSTDGGNTFTHLKNFPAYGTLCIRYIERSTPVLIAAVEDWWLATDRRSTIWYSTDQGNTWTKSRLPAVPIAYTVISSPINKAYDIDYSSSSGIIYAATDYGLLQSTDGGVNFTYRETASSMAAAYRTNPVMNSVECGSGNKVYMAGPSGFYYSEDGGVRWTRYDLPVNPSRSSVIAKNSISVVPSTNTVMLLTSKTWADASYFAEEYLYSTTNNGGIWANIITTPVGDGGCGGRPSVECRRKTAPGGNDSCIVYISNRCKLFRKGFKINPGGVIDFSNTAAWAAQNHYHDDVHELTFSNESTGNDNPLYLSTDAGLHKYRSGTDYPLISGPYRGLNALMVYDMAGQTIRNSSGSYLHYLYYGTQDNLLGFWIDRLPPLEGYPTIFWEGRGLETGLYGGNITYTKGSPYANFIAGLKYRDPRLFNNCPGNIWWPLYIKDQCYVQLGTPPGSSPGTVGLYLTRNGGRRWWLIWSKTGEAARIPKVFRTGDNTAEIFMPVLNADGNRVFTKIITDLTYFSFLGEDLIPPVTFSFMPSFNNFGKLGNQQWEIPVFGVNPANTDHIIAPDMQSKTIKQSTDGGNNWTEITGLTNRIIADGQYKLRTEFDGSFVSSVGFSPSGQNVIIGTAMNGVFWSSDRGVSWGRLDGSESLRNVYQPYFKPIVSGRAEDEEVFLPTHGRGIWKVTIPRRPLFLTPDNFPYWRYLLEQPRDMGLITGNSQFVAFNTKASSNANMILFHPDSVRLITNGPNGISVQLAANSNLYSNAAGFVPADVLDAPGIAYSKLGVKTSNAPNTGANAKKITGVLVEDKKIIALVSANEPPPFFITAKERGTMLAKKNPPYDEKKLNQYKDRFFVSEQGRRFQLTACNVDTRNGARSSFAVYLGDNIITNLQINKPVGCTSIPLSLNGLAPGKYELLIKPKGSAEVAGRVMVEVRGVDGK